MSALRRLAPPALLLVAGAALGFVRTSDDRTDVCVYWPERTVTWRINPARSPEAAAAGSCAGSAAREAVADAFAAWEGATRAGERAPCTDLALVDGGTSSSTRAGYSGNGGNENLVVFRQGWCSDHVLASDPCWEAGTCANEHGCFQDDSPSDRSIIAITTVTYDTGSGEILDADIEAADWDGAVGTLDAHTARSGWYFTCGDEFEGACERYGDDGCAHIDLRNTMTHEAGHFVGLAHVPATSANSGVTMFPDTRPLDFAKRDLAADDVEGVCTIYPAGEGTPRCGTRGEGGCASAPGPAGGGGALLLAAAALAALARRARRARATTSPHTAARVPARAGVWYKSAR